MRQRQRICTARCESDAARARRRAAATSAAERVEVVEAAAVVEYDYVVLRLPVTCGLIVR